MVQYSAAGRMQLNPVERYTTLAARVPEGKHFVFGNSFIFYFGRMYAMGGGGVRSALFGV
jgi:hypothetical protein